MNKAKKMHLGTLIALLLLGGIGTAFAWAPQGKGTLPSARKIAPFSSLAVNLNLSEDQIKKLQDLRLEYQKETLELKNALRAKQLELQALLASNEVDENKASSIVEEIGKLSTDIWKKSIHYRLEMRKILTEEQWNKLLFYRHLGGRRGKDRGGRGAWLGPLP